MNTIHHQHSHPWTSDRNYIANDRIERPSLSTAEDLHSTAPENFHCSHTAAEEVERSSRTEVAGIAVAEEVRSDYKKAAGTVGTPVDTAVTPHNSLGLDHLWAVVHKGSTAVGARAQVRFLVVDRGCHIVSASLDKSLRHRVNHLELHGMHHQ